MMVLAFTQIKTPIGGVAASTLLALAPVVTLLVLLAVFRVTAWVAVIGGSIVTLILAIFAWSMPPAEAFRAYGDCRAR